MTVRGLDGAEGRTRQMVAASLGVVLVVTLALLDGPWLVRLGAAMAVLALGCAVWVAEGRGQAQALRADDLDQRLTRSLTLDPLTGLPNRSTARAWIDERLDRGEPTAVLVVDIDRLKLLADAVGHSEAEAVVVVMAERARHAVAAWGPEGDWFVARGDDDEFIVVVSSLPGIQGLKGLGEAVVAAASADIALPGRGGVSVTVSVGVATEEEVAAATGATAASPAGSPWAETSWSQLPGAQLSGIDAEALLAGADLAVNEAKRRGRSRVEVLNDQLRAAGKQRTRRLQDLSRAVTRHGEIEVWAQPIVDLRRRRTVGAEALMRWRHPFAGVLEAREFLAAAQEAGMMRALGDRVLDQTCGALARGASPWMAVNLSTRELYDPSLCGRVQRALTQHGVDAGRLCLEVNESALLDPTMMPVLKDLESLGVGLAIDDFGVGASPLLQMQTLRRPVLKLDGSFVSQLDAARPERATAMIGTFVHLAAQLGLAVVAEGVETEEQSDRLLDLGVPFAQGFLFGRPAPLADLPPADLDDLSVSGPTSAPHPPWTDGNAEWLLRSAVGV